MDVKPTMGTKHQGRDGVEYNIEIADLGGAKVYRISGQKQWQDYDTFWMTYMPQIEKNNIKVLAAEAEIRATPKPERINPVGPPSQGPNPDQTPSPAVVPFGGGARAIEGTPAASRTIAIVDATDAATSTIPRRPPAPNTAQATSHLMKWGRKITDNRIGWRW